MFLPKNHLHIHIPFGFASNFEEACFLLVFEKLASRSYFEKIKNRVYVIIKLNLILESKSFDYYLKIVRDVSERIVLEISKKI